MPEYRLTEAAWLEKEVERVKSVLACNLVHGQSYTVEEILQILQNLGLDYSNPQYQEIGQQLIAQGVIEAV